ncbi:MAG TPA: cysteine--tRNA ligase [Armatimonadota bacterium]|jgi:cysteinyl-tRNA synthetase
MLRLYNSLSRREEEFTPADGHTVKLYSCGPTVYNFAHIGNLRSFLFYDLLCRYLRYTGWEVHQVMNLTDVDDKTILGARSEGVSLGEFTEGYATLFFEDLTKLGIKPAWKYPRATAHIPQMLDLIQTLVDKGHAYVSEGSVYFNIASFPQYGRLAGITPEAGEEAREFGRLQADEYERETVADFVLWKAAKEGEPSWDSPWGPGRPGWHIECSAMAKEYLGDTLDIHTGAVDLLFPHHENEIAQSEAATGKPFSRFWLHAEFLIVDGHKMSKSLGNFFTLRDLLDKGFRPMAIRHQLLSAHYRKQLNFTLEGLQQSEAALDRLLTYVSRLPRLPLAAGETAAVTEIVRRGHERFREALDADLNVPGALGAVYEVLAQTNPLIESGAFQTGDRDQVLAFLRDTDQVLGLLTEALADLEAPQSPEDAEIDALVAERTAARAEKNWARGDEIRDELTARGIIVEDTPAGPVWRRST